MATRTRSARRSRPPLKTRSKMASTKRTRASSSERIEHLRKIINNAHVGMLVTRSRDGGMHGRPMANSQVEKGFREIWFATNRSSAKIDELEHDDRVFVGYGNATGSEWAAVSGRARVVDDRAKMRELWDPMWRNWWNDANDPDLILVHVTPHQAEYWDSGGKLIQLVKFALGTILRKDMTADDNKKVKLHR